MSQEEITDADLPKKKKVKGLKDMFKSISDAGDASAGMGGMFSMLAILEPIMKPLEIVLKIIGTLFQVMGAEILPPLMEAMQPIFDMLMDLQPVFAELGQHIGNLLAMILPPLIELFIMLFVAIKPLIPKLMELVVLFVNLIVQALPLILPIITTIVTVIIAVLKPILDWLGSISPSELALVIYFLGLGLSALYGLFTGGPWMAAIYGALWAALMSPLLFMQEGGILTRPTRIVGGEAGNEGVIPLDQFWASLDEMTTQQEQTNTYLREIRNDKLFRHSLRRGFR